MSLDDNRKIDSYHLLKVHFQFILISYTLGSMWIFMWWSCAALREWPIPPCPVARPTLCAVCVPPCLQSSEHLYRDAHDVFTHCCCGTPSLTWFSDVAPKHSIKSWPLDHTCSNSFTLLFQTFYFSSSLALSLKCVPPLVTLNVALDESETMLHPSKKCVL